MSKKKTGKIIGTLIAVAGILAMGTAAIGGAALKTIVTGIKVTGSTVKETLEKVHKEEKVEVISTEETKSTEN